jgi:hypothetical protein
MPFATPIPNANVVARLTSETFDEGLTLECERLFELSIATKWQFCDQQYDKETFEMQSVKSSLLVMFFALLLDVFAYAQGAKLQIINGQKEDIEIFWQRPDGQRVSNGIVHPGQNQIVNTTIGHKFALVNTAQKSERVVVSQVNHQAYRVGGVPDFYSQQINANGYPIVASSNVSPYALKEAAYLIDLMLAKRPDVRDAMIKSGSRLCVMASNEFTTDLPEFRWLGEQKVNEFPFLPPRDYWDARARGLGGSETDPFCSCAEENLLAYEGDPYSTECILIHEFAHNIHLRGLMNVDATFDDRLQACYRSAIRKKLWAGKYAAVNHHEYFAEGVQSWFDNNREDDHDHNHVDTREELIGYDPGLAKMCEEVFGETELRYTMPQQRLKDHLSGYDPSKAPKFVWPPRLSAAQKAIHEHAVNRSAQAR